jgi:phosphonate transport system permease protein
LLIAAAALVISSFQGVGFSVSDLVGGLPQMMRILGEMVPPSHDRWDRVFYSLLETFHMALAGTVLGVVLSVPLAVLACRSLTPSWPLRAAARSLIAVFRTVPDVVWALIFVVAVGLGPFAGTLALMVDTMGYAARFFADAMEEQEKGPQEALAAAGAPRIGVLMAAVLPAAMPSMVTTSLFCLEKATRGGVVPGRRGRHRHGAESVDGPVQLRGSRSGHPRDPAARDRGGTGLGRSAPTHHRLVSGCWLFISAQEE